MNQIISIIYPFYVFFITYGCKLQPQVATRQVFFWIFSRCLREQNPHCTMDDATIKRNLERKRNELGLSQTEMAHRLEISLNAYRKLVQGDTRIINVHVTRFADETGTSLAELVNGFEPVSSIEKALDSIREAYNSRIEELNGQISSLEDEIRRLEEKIKDKEAVIASDQRLIARYEKELGLDGQQTVGH